MKASKFSDAQKAFILKQGADGMPVAEICRKAGISQATYFNWKKRYDGLLPTEIQQDLRIAVLTLAIALSLWVNFARTARASVLVERSKDYVQAAIIMGQHPLRVMLRHILPNIMGPLLVIMTVDLASAILLEATLSFLGIGLPADSPSLGTLIRIGMQFLLSGEWWILWVPTLFLVALVVSINVLGDFLRDVFNPRLR